MPALLAEMPKPLKQRKKVGIKNLKEEMTSWPMSYIQKPQGQTPNIKTNAEPCCNWGIDHSKLGRLDGATEVCTNAARLGAT